jgi:hypothetical protein
MGRCARRYGSCRPPMTRIRASSWVVSRVTHSEHDLLGRPALCAIYRDHDLFRATSSRPYPYGSVRRTSGVPAKRRHRARGSHVSGGSENTVFSSEAAPLLSAFVSAAHADRARGAPGRDLTASRSDDQSGHARRSSSFSERTLAQALPARCSTIARPPEREIARVVRVPEQAGRTVHPSAPLRCAGSTNLPVDVAALRVAPPVLAARARPCCPARRRRRPPHLRCTGRSAGVTCTLPESLSAPHAVRRRARGPRWDRCAVEVHPRQTAALDVSWRFSGAGTGPAGAPSASTPTGGGVRAE